MPHKDKNKRKEMRYKYQKSEKGKLACRKTKLKRMYGLTIEQYDFMLEQQNYVCAICKRAECSLDPRSQQPYRLALDHNHTTGKVRALLCFHCNRCVGVFENYKEQIEKYLITFDEVYK